MWTTTINATRYSSSQLTKTKIDYPLSLNEVKRHLRIDNTFTDDDDYLDTLIKVGTGIAEDYIEKDIAKTNNELKLTDFYGGGIRINEGNFISVISIINDASIAIEPVIQTMKQDSFFQLHFEDIVFSSPLFINFYTGFDEYQTPDVIKHAINIIISNLYDSQRSSITWGGYNDNEVWKKILDKYRIIRF